MEKARKTRNWLENKTGREGWYNLLLTIFHLLLLRYHHHVAHHFQGSL